MNYFLQIKFGPMVDNVGRAIQGLKEYVPQDVRQDLDDVVEGKILSYFLL